jgi:hypothetical protein
LRDELVALLQAGQIDQSLVRKLNRRLWRIQRVIVRDRQRAICRHADRWAKYVQRRLGDTWTPEELARLLDPMANLRSTVPCPA